MGKVLEAINDGELVDVEFFQSVAKLIQNARASVEKQVNTAMVITYFEIGRRIVEKEQLGAKRAQYGKKVLQGLADYLTANLGLGYSVDNLKLMRRFYVVYSAAQIGESVITQFIENISWTHYILLMRIENPDERRFYEIEIANNNWSFREFQRQYDSSLYERLALSCDKEKVMELANVGQVVALPQDIFKDPYVLEFTGLPEKSQYSETQLEQKLIDHLQNFMLELGKGFSFEARQKRFTFDEKSFYVDLVFYNRLLDCYVIIDLKTDDLEHKDLGQMQMYVNYFDRYVKTEHEKPTIGILLCRKKSDSIVELTLPIDSNIYASEYSLYLPDKSLLQAKLAEWGQEFEEAKEILAIASSDKLDKENPADEVGGE